MVEYLYEDILYTRAWYCHCARLHIVALPGGSCEQRMFSASSPTASVPLCSANAGQLAAQETHLPVPIAWSVFPTLPVPLVIGQQL